MSHMVGIVGDGDPEKTGARVVAGPHGTWWGPFCSDVELPTSGILQLGNSW